MLPLKKSRYFVLLVLLVASCKNSQIEPTSILKPEQIQEITEQKALAKKMLTSVPTRLPDGRLSAVIAREGDNGKLELAINRSGKMLSELCRIQENCVGGVYVSVHNNQGKGELFHRIHKGKKLQIACVWLESYSFEFGPVDNALQKEVIGRSWHWVKACFEE